MALINKEPVMFPYVCRYRLNKICEKQKTTSLSPRCISLLSERSSATIIPSKNFGNNSCSSQSQPSMERLLIRTTETNLKKYGFQSCQRFPDLTFSPGQPLHAQNVHSQCNASCHCGKKWKSLGDSNFGLQVISYQPAAKGKILEDQDFTRPRRKRIKSLRQRISPIKQNETDYLQVVSSPPRIKKIMSYHVAKTECAKTLHDHFLCERFEMHMANHLQRSKSEILQKSYATHGLQQLSTQRPMSSAAAIKSHSMNSPKFLKRLNPLKNTNFGMGIAPPTSPEFHTEPNGFLSQQEAEKLTGRTDFGNISALDKSSSSSFLPETRNEAIDFLEREKARLSAEENKTVLSFSEKDQKHLQSVKDRLNLLPGEKNGQKEKLKSSVKKAKDFSALGNEHDLRSSFYQETVNKQETISDAEQRNVIMTSSPNFIADKSLKQTLDANQTEKETSQDNQLKISDNESSSGSRQVSKKTKKPNQIPSPVLKEVKSEDNPETDFDFDKKDNGETIDNSLDDKGEGSQVKLEKPKLPSFQGKLNLKKKTLKKKLTGLNSPDVQDLLKPLPSQRHKQYFDPQELAERRRKKLLEKMNHKKILFDEASPTQQSLFQDYGWLAKYCIFNNDNWTIYGRTFESADTKNKGWLTPKETMMALRTANSQLTPSEEEYLCRIIELTGYSIDDGSDLRLFSILAALSHRITSLDNWMKSLLDNIDYRLLDMKTFKCKTLWECNVDPETNKISLEQLCVELRVGGVSLTHEQEVKDRLQHLKALDLLDFLTYIPLFIMIHESVVDNPLDFTRQK